VPAAILRLLLSSTRSSANAGAAVDLDAELLLRAADEFLAGHGFPLS